MKPSDWGWRLVFIAGLVPAMTGLLMLALSLWSATAGKEGPWVSLVGQHSFSAARLEREGTDLYALWLLSIHLCAANLAMSGATISTLAWFALRNRKRWAWAFLWVLILWVGGNDIAALIQYRVAVGSGLPYALIPLTGGSAGLIRTRWEARTSGEVKPSTGDDLWQSGDGFDCLTLGSLLDHAGKREGAIDATATTHHSTRSDSRTL